MREETKLLLEYNMENVGPAGKQDWRGFLAEMLILLEIRKSGIQIKLKVDKSFPASRV